MRVRKGALKSNIRYKYFENLSLLFKKSNYWHYHAFAFYNKYLAAQKNPKLTAKDRKELSDELLLSVLILDLCNGSWILLIITVKEYIFSSENESERET